MVRDQLRCTPSPIGTPGTPNLQAALSNPVAYLQQTQIRWTGREPLQQLGRAAPPTTPGTDPPPMEAIGGGVVIPAAL
jgi:hypothetical protein